MSDFYNKYPYTDFHELNLDWVIERVKKLTDDWLATHEEWVGVQQDWADTEQAWIDFKAYVENYLANLDVQDEIDHKIDQMVLDGSLRNLIKPDVEVQTINTTTDWLNDHITQPTTPVVDTSLTIPGAAADAAVTGSRLNDLDIATDALTKSYLDTCINFDEQNIETSLTGTTTSGYYYDAVSHTYETNANFKTIRYAVDPDSIYKATGRYQGTRVALIAFLDSNDDFISSSPVGVGGGLTTETVYMISPSAAASAIVTVYSYLPGDSLTKISAGYNINTNIEALQNVTSDFYVSPVIVPDSTGTTLSGYYYSRASHSLVSYASMKTIDFNVSADEVYSVSGRIGGNDVALVSFLGTSDVFISDTGMAGADGQKSYDHLIVPQNAVKMRICVYTYLPTLTIEQFTPMSIRNAIDYNSKRWFNAKVNVLGDSITQGYLTTKTWAEFLQDRYQFGILRNYGIGGSTITKIDAGDTTNSMALRYVNMDDDADLIIVNGGMNDGGQPATIGQMGDTTVDTYYGALYTLCDGLLSKYPKGTIIFTSTIQCTHHSNANYIEPMREVCSYFSIPFVDLFTGSGITSHNAANISETMADTMHPNINGHERMANAIAHALY